MTDIGGTKIVPAARPLVPIKKGAAAIGEDSVNGFTYEAMCKVAGCGWSKRFVVRAALQYGVDTHKGEHHMAQLRAERSR